MDEAIMNELSSELHDQLHLEETPLHDADSSAMVPGNDDYSEMFKSMKKKKKKSSKKIGEGAEEGDALNEEISEAADSTEKENDARYASLLSRIFTILRLQNPDMAGERKKYSMIPPNVQREGTKKTMFANISEISKRMNRPMEHVIQYLFSELGTTGSTDASERLIIKGRFQQRQMENVLKHYIMEYVTCKTCKSGNTSLRKENRLSFMVCESCGSTRSVSAIKTGFKAQTEKRRAQRAKEG